MIHKKPIKSQVTSDIDFGALDFFRQASKENEIETRKKFKNTRKRKKDLEDVKKTESSPVEETETSTKKKKKKKKRNEGL